MTNEVLQAIEARRSCRSYEERQILPEELSAVTRAGTWAPTGMGRQAVKIVVVQDKDTVAKLERIFGVGTIIIHSSDKSTPHIDLVNVKEPLVVKELIHKHVEVMKVSRNIRVSEFLDDGPTAPDPCTHGEHK